MRLFRRRDDFRDMDDAKVKGVSIDYSGSHADNFATNMVTIRTVSTESLSIGSYGLMYRRQPAVRTVVDFLARNIGQLNPKVYERVSDTDRVDVTDHPLAVLLRNPNPADTRFRHMAATVADLGIYDRAYWRKYRQNGRLVAVQRISPEAICPATDNEGRRVYRDQRGREIPRGDLVVFPGYSPDTADDGVSPLETLRQVLYEDAAAIGHRGGMWQNAARQAGVIERPLDAPEWSDIARERFRQDWQETYAGERNSGKTVVLEEGMKWNAASFSPEQTQYIESRELTREEVALVYFGPVAGEAFLQATGTGTEATHNQIYQDVLGPWLERLQGEIELQVLPEFEPMSSPGRVYVEFNIHAKLKGSFQAQAEALTTAVGVPYMAVNEGRARLNLPQIAEPWADQPVQPLNVMYGGQPAVTVPVNETASTQPEAKALEACTDSAVTEHADLLRSYLDRMERTVTSAKTVDVDRWNRELTADLYLKAQQTARAAGRLNPGYDEKAAVTFLLDSSEAFAQALNSGIAAAVAADPDGIKSVFNQYRTGADNLATVRATELVAYASKEHP